MICFVCKKLISSPQAFNFPYVFVTSQILFDRNDMFSFSESKSEWRYWSNSGKDSGDFLLWGGALVRIPGISSYGAELWWGFLRFSLMESSSGKDSGDFLLWSRALVKILAISSYEKCPKLAPHEEIAGFLSRSRPHKRKSPESLSALGSIRGNLRNPYRSSAP